MKILLIMNQPYTFWHVGANRCNRSTAEALVRRDHQVRIIAPALATPSRITHDQLIDQLTAEGIKVRIQDAVDLFSHNGVEIHAVVKRSNLRRYLADQICEFAPDWILVASEDRSPNLLAEALSVFLSKVIYIANTPRYLPFGPQAFARSLS